MNLVSAFTERMASRTFGRGFLAATLAVLVLSGLPSAYGVVVFDNFSDLTDGSAGTVSNPTPSPPNVSGPVWSRLDAAVATSGQKWNASSGAYRMCAPTTPGGNCDPTFDDDNDPNTPPVQQGTFGSTSPGVEGYDFVGSYVASTSFTDVRVTADIVDFIAPGSQSSFFAVGARMNGNNLPPSDATGLQFRGYSYQYEGTSAGGLGEMVLTILHGSGLKDVGSFPLTLDTAKDYRVVFEVIGNTLHGQVFEVTDVANGGIVGVMVADQTRNLDTNPADPDDYDGPLNPVRPFIPYTSGFSGVYGVGHAFGKDPDFTIDNFKSESIGVAGDYNANGVVDAADYVLWRNGGPLQNEVDAPGTVNAADYTAWRARFGNTSGSGSAASVVPEPASVMLVMLGIVCFWLGRRNTV